MKISIITINFNNCSGLEKTINSVISQTLDNFEYIIIDGGSTDGSAELLEKYSQFFSFWISEPDTGIYNAMNKGIAKATGNYLNFLNSGDCYSDSTILQRCYDSLVEDPEQDIYYGDIYVVNDNRNINKWLRTHPETLNLKFFFQDTINHQASLIKSELFKEFNFYPEQYNVASDYWFYLKCLLNNKKFCYLNFPMVDYDLTGISFSNNASYRFEKKLIWDSLVPPCVLDLMGENEKCKNKLNEFSSYRIMNAALEINSRYQRFKSFFLKRGRTL